MSLLRTDPDLPAQPSLLPERLAGVVERIVYHDPDSGFCVLRTNVRGHRGLVTIVGHAAAVAAGEFVEAEGNWVNDRTHGVQFRARTLGTSAPTTVAGIEAYLASGLVRGVGPVYARKLVRSFGTRVFDVIERDPRRLREVPGIGGTRAVRIAEAWADQRAVRDIMVFLHAHGVGAARAVRIHRTYGQAAVERIRADPYRLARDVRGIGFATADQIARRIGIAPDATTRVRAGIFHALATARDDGHCGLPVAELVDLAARLLEVPPHAVEDALRLEVEAGGVVAARIDGREAVFDAALARAEQAVADRLRALARGAPPWPAPDPDAAIRAVEQRTGIVLADGQRAAVRLALASKVLVVTGGPGVGKTTLVDAVLGSLADAGLRIALAAPTGRAARRLSESTGREARTIHRLLEVDPVAGGFRRDVARPIDADLVVVDEMSMVDLPLMSALLRAVPPGAALLMVGDADQLPSVGPGQVLADLIGSRAVPAVRLTEVFRQAAGSRIVANAHRINRGEPPDLRVPEGGTDFYFVDARDAADGVAKLVEIVARRIPRRFGLDPVRDVQVLCPMNRGGLGARSLNLELQRALNPNGAPGVERFGWRFAVGDKVMQVENDYEREVYNGDLGVIASVDPAAAELSVLFDGRPVSYAFAELDRLVLAYATTIHKSQGSEYPAVVVPVTTRHYPMLTRNLLYTAVTRARRLVVLVGERQALAIAVRRAHPRRWSRLAERLGAD